MELLTIGQFARFTGLTVRAVRHYGELGLLDPARVDPETGYRYYASRQVADAATIRRLRSLELPLEEIGEILKADDPDLVRSRLVEQWARMAERAASTEQILTVLQRLIEGEETLVPIIDIRSEVEIKEVPDQPVLVIRERVPLERLPEVIPASIAEAHAHLEAVASFAGPPLIVCPFPDEDGMVELETCWPVSGEVPGAGRIEYAILPAATMLTYLHRGPYQELGSSYRAMQAVVDGEGLTVAGAPREIYLTSPVEVPDPADWLTEIQFPIVRDEARISTLAKAGAM